VRSLLVLVLGVTGLALAAAPASAQCCYIAPPRAPDMLNPGYWYTNCFGVTYWPNHCVYPPFPPFQGMLLGPGKGAGPTPREIQALAGFPRHLYARSPRDYFMYDTDPRAAPYSYGSVTPGLPFGLPGGAVGDNVLPGSASEGGSP
jgi:hypothetical protein